MVINKSVGLFFLLFIFFVPKDNLMNNQFSTRVNCEDNDDDDNQDNKDDQLNWLVKMFVS